MPVVKDEVTIYIIKAGTTYNTPQKYKPEYPISENFDLSAENLLTVSQE